MTLPVPLAVVATTIGVAVAAALGALVLGAVLAAAVRVRSAGARVALAAGQLGLRVPPFVVPLALVTLAGRDASLLPVRPGPAAIALAQALAFAPHACVLIMRALAGVSAESEQAAELLGASRWTVLRRVTLGLAGGRLLAAAFVVLGLCLADVTAPLLLGGPEPVVLAAWIVSPNDRVVAAGAGALVLATLTVSVALLGRTWRELAPPFRVGAPPAGGLAAPPAVRALLAALASAISVVVGALWATLPVASLAASREGWHLTLDHWNVSLAAGRSLGDSLLLGLGAAVVATALTVAAGLAARARSVAAPAIAVLARVPIAIPGLVAGVAVAVAVGAPRRDLALIAVLVAAWELPLTLPIVGAVLARADRASEQAAVSLGAGRLATLGRVVMPALSPAAASIFVHGFTAGLTAVGTVIVLAERGRLALGVTSMLASASTGAVGAACAVATVLLALAGGATLLGRAVAGRESIPTLLA